LVALTKQTQPKILHDLFWQKMSENGKSKSDSKTTIAGKRLRKTKVFPEKDY
jgi:hypothetical protein